MITRSGRRKSHTRTFTGISSHPLPFISIPSKSALSIPWDRGMPSNTRFCATAKSAVPFTMPFYDIDPLVSINGDDVANVFYPSRIDNSKIMIGCQNSEFPRSSVIVDLSVVTVDTGWNYKHENIHMSRERRKRKAVSCVAAESAPDREFHTRLLFICSVHPCVCECTRECDAVGHRLQQAREDVLKAGKSPIHVPGAELEPEESQSSALVRSGWFHLPLGWIDAISLILRIDVSARRFASGICPAELTAFPVPCSTPSKRRSLQPSTTTPPSTYAFAVVFIP